MITLTPMLILVAICIAIAMRFKQERAIVLWLLISGFIHVLCEVNYGFFYPLVAEQSAITFSEFLLVPASLGEWFDPRWWVGFYEQYARYDARYSLHGPTVILLCYAEILMGPACFFLVWLIKKGSRFRHPCQLVLCSLQIFGTFIYFFHPMVAGTWSEVMTQDPFEQIVYIWILNGLWIAIPSILVAQSVRAMAQNSAIVETNRPLTRQAAATPGSPS